MIVRIPQGTSLFGQKKACKMNFEEDFTAYTSAKATLYTSKGSAKFEEAMATCCPKKCLHYE
jgi:hypothetical protein